MIVICTQKPDKGEYCRAVEPRQIYDVIKDENGILFLTDDKGLKRWYNAIYFEEVSKVNKHKKGEMI